MFDHYNPEDDSHEHVLEHANNVFNIIFLVEMLIKMFAFGIKGYLRDNINKFDCIIVTAGIVDLVLDQTIILEVDQKQAGSAME